MARKTAAEIVTLLDAFETSGQTRDEFAEANGIGKSSLDHYKANASEYRRAARAGRKASVNGSTPKRNQKRPSEPPGQSVELAALKKENEQLRMKFEKLRDLVIELLTI